MIAANIALTRRYSENTLDVKRNVAPSLIDIENAIVIWVFREMYLCRGNQVDNLSCKEAEGALWGPKFLCYRTVLRTGSQVTRYILNVS